MYRNPGGRSRAVFASKQDPNCEVLLRDMNHACGLAQPLRNQLLHHLAMHIGQPEVAAGVAIGELLVIEAEQLQDRGVQIVDVHRFSTALKPNSSVAPVHVAAFHAAAGQPDGEAVVIVIAAVDFAGVASPASAIRPPACGRIRRPR